MLPPPTRDPMYALYRPVRNRAKRYDLYPALLALWAYSVHVIDQRPLSFRLARGAASGVQLNRHVFPHDMAIIARELLLNARQGGGGDLDLGSWQGLADLVNEIKRADRRMSRAEVRGTSMEDVMWELHRQSHHQFPLQQHFAVASLVRSLRIYGQSALEELLQQKTGLTMVQLLRLGFALQGNFLRQPTLNATTDYSAFGIPRYASTRFFETMAADVPTLRERLAVTQSLGREWLLTFNELTRTPLVRIDPSHPERLLCPVPRLLFDRVTNGVFFDLVSMPGFSSAFGPAFQGYVGDVLRRACADGKFRVFEEQTYQPVKARLRHGVDWIWSDASAHVFIECKTKRFTFDAKMLTDAAALDRDLVTFAKAVAQHYGNIVDARNNLTSWTNDGLPIHPVLVTLDDLYLFGSAVRDRLNGHVRDAMQQAHLPPTLLIEMPWQIVSVRELEMAAQVVGQRCIADVFGAPDEARFHGWTLDSTLRERFPEELAQTKVTLFPEDVERLFPWPGGVRH